MDQQYELCILGATRIRKILLFFGFCSLITWILFGTYGNYNSKDAILPPDTFKISRSLLGLAVNQQDELLEETFDPNGTNDNVECGSIYDYNESVYCDFVKKVPSCGGDDGFIPYFDFLYCHMPIKLVPLSMIILVFWLLYLFVFLGTTAESFFCRELAYITELLKLSQNVAQGVTLLAIGNGAPDIFSAIAAFNHPDPKKSSLAFGALFGAGMFVTNIVVGLVCIFHPFRLTRRPFLRDNIFYLFAVYWVLFLLWENEISLLQAIGFLVFYIGYVLVVILGSLIYQRWIKWRTKLQQKEVVQFTNEHQEKDSLGQSQTGKVTIEDSDDTNSDEEQTQKKVHVKYGSTLPVIVLTKSNKDSDSSDSSSRPVTPSQQSALRASRRVYGTSNQVGSTPRNNEEFREETPRPRSRLEQVLDNAVFIAEDVIASSNPNLAKLWHTEYSKEIRREKQGNRSTTPYFSTTAATPTIDEETIFHDESSDSSSDEEKPLTASDDNKMQPTEDMPILNHPKQNTTPLRKLLNALFPFISNSFKSSSIFSKVFQIIKYPLTLVLTLTIPVVDIDEPLNNWNKWLTVMQCITAPLFISFATGFAPIFIKEVFPVIVIVFVLSIGLAVLVALTSSVSKPPIYHCLLAWIGFALSIMWIYTIANEIVNVLQVFGVVVKLSDDILGITLLAWGNSIQDSVTNVTMARQGFPRMAVGACFGGPLLNILIGIGLASIIKLVNEDGNSFEIYMTQVTMLAAFFLILSLCLSLLVTTCLQYHMYRLYGVCLFLFYLAFLVVVILAELSVFEISIHGVLSVID